MKENMGFVSIYQANPVDVCSETGRSNLTELRKRYVQILNPRHHWTERIRKNI